MGIRWYISENQGIFRSLDLPFLLISNHFHLYPHHHTKHCYLHDRPAGFAFSYTVNSVYQEEKSQPETANESFNSLDKKHWGLFLLSRYEHEFKSFLTSCSFPTVTLSELLHPTRGTFLTCFLTWMLPNSEVSSPPSSLIIQTINITLSEVIHWDIVELYLFFYMHLLKMTISLIGINWTLEVV